MFLRGILRVMQYHLMSVSPLYINTDYLPAILKLWAKRFGNRLVFVYDARSAPHPDTYHISNLITLILPRQKERYKPDGVWKHTWLLPVSNTLWTTWPIWRSVQFRIHLLIMLILRKLDLISLLCSNACIQGVVCAVHCWGQEMMSRLA